MLEFPSFDSHRLLGWNSSTFYASFDPLCHLLAEREDIVIRKRNSLRAYLERTVSRAPEQKVEPIEEGNRNGLSSKVRSLTAESFPERSFFSFVMGCRKGPRVLIFSPDCLCRVRLTHHEG